MPRQRVMLLDADPDLAEGIPGEELELARQHAVARVLQLDGPIWNPEPVIQASEPGSLGLFQLEGLMIRRVRVGKRLACELLGPGDIVRPWDADGEYDPLPISLDWLVVRPTRLAVLDTAFALRVARWPQITAHLLGRIAQRARNLALAQAVTHLPRTHPRLLMLFWILADRWGTVSGEGVRVNLPLTHETLAMLVGSRRPTVTIALQRLARAGLLIRESNNRWLLTTRAIELLAHPERLGVPEDETRSEQLVPPRAGVP
ncbi:MAG TPA: Crp/Fnr family transcriptional regulator [Solirubrobacteraceae bacterium]|nr:Crp/Fnr family transcriptional regulator [Solirubrobacteraceae bacterium]